MTIPKKVDVPNLKKLASAILDSKVVTPSSLEKSYQLPLEALLKTYLLLRLIKCSKVTSQLESKTVRSRKKSIVAKKGQIQISIWENSHSVLVALLYCASNGNKRANAAKILHEIMKLWRQNNKVVPKLKSFDRQMMRFTDEDLSNKTDKRCVGEKNIDDAYRTSLKSLLRWGIAQIRVEIHNNKLQRVVSVGVEHAASQNGFQHQMHLAKLSGYRIVSKEVGIKELIKIDSSLDCDSTGSVQPKRKGRQRRLVADKRGGMANFTGWCAPTAEDLHKWILENSLLI